MNMRKLSVSFKYILAPQNNLKMNSQYNTLRPRNELDLDHQKARQGYADLR